MALQEAYAIEHPQRITIDSATTANHPNTIISFSSDNNSDKQIFERGLVDMEHEKEMTELKTQLAEKDAKLAEFEKKERGVLEVKYADLCKAKGVDSIDVKEMDNSVLDFLVKQVELIKEADVDEPEAKASEEEPKAKEPKKEEAEPEKKAEDEEEESDEEEVDEKANYRIFQTSDSDMLKGTAFTVEFKQPVSSNYI